VKISAAATLIVLVVLTAPRGRAATALPQSAAPPNIVWISTEDMSPHLGAYGDAVSRTPTLDRFAAQAIRFTHAFSTAPVCAPSRAAIITGMHQAAIGAQHMRTSEDGVPELPGPYLAVPPFYVKAFPEYLRAAGYFTSNRAKTDYQFGVPFTIWDDLGRDAHWRNRPNKSQPFFSVFNIEGTHESQSFPSSPSRKGKPPVTRAADVRVPPYYPDTPAVRDELARMYDNIQDMDAQVGAILRQLEEDGHADDTIVFFWSDHGDGVPRAKRSLYDSGLRVPLMIRVPPRFGGGAAPGSVRNDLVSLVDLAPTVLAVAGLDPPRHMQGRALIGPRTGPTPDYVFGARDRMDAEYDMIRSARDGRYLYIRNFSPELPYAGHIIYRNQSAIMQEWLRLQAEGALTGPPALWMRTTRPAEELYDVRRDPHHIDNLAHIRAHRHALERMRDAVSSWMTRIGDQGLINEAEMIQRMWPGGAQPVTATPYVVPRRATARTERQETIALSGPLEVVIYVPTQGASIGYTTDAGSEATWRLYTGPILVRGPMTLRAKAIRYGYKESDEVRVAFTQ
jgi:N-sulfoglucosamine sulfohydrolase